MGVFQRSAALICANKLSIDLSNQPTNQTKKRANQIDNTISRVIEKEHMPRNKYPNGFSLRVRVSEGVRSLEPQLEAQALDALLATQSSQQLPLIVGRQLESW